MKINKFLAAGVATVALSMGHGSTYADDGGMPVDNSNNAYAQQNAQDAQRAVGVGVQKLGNTVGTIFSGLQKAGGAVKDAVTAPAVQQPPFPPSQAYPATRDQMAQRPGTPIGTPVGQATPVGIPVGVQATQQPGVQPSPMNSPAAQRLGNSVEQFKGHLSGVLDKIRSGAQQPNHQNSNSMTPN